MDEFTVILRHPGNEPHIEVVLRSRPDSGGTEYATHMLNKSLGGYHYGHYFHTWDDESAGVPAQVRALKDYLARIERGY